MFDQYYILFAVYLVGATVLSILINALFLKFASSLGIRNSSETTIRWSTQVKPALGGISFFLIFLISVAIYPIFFEQHTVFNKQVLGILAAATLAFLLGLSDDAYNTRPLLKLMIQIICSIILVYSGTYINIFNTNYLNYAITIFWVVAMMNSINMLDNMDGITTVVSIGIIIGALFMVFLHGDISSINALMLVGVIAALTGFLFFNFHPSKMFMGDTGSQFLGLFLAAIGIVYFWNATDVFNQKIPSKQFFITILIFAIPIIDTTSVIINRLKKGKSPFIGGKDHTTHSFFNNGLTEKRIAVLYIGITLFSIFLNYLILIKIQNWNYLHIILFSIYFLALFWFFYAPTLPKRQAKNDKT